MDDKFSLKNAIGVKTMESDTDDYFGLNHGFGKINLQENLEQARIQKNEIQYKFFEEQIKNQSWCIERKVKELVNEHLSSQQAISQEDFDYQIDLINARIDVLESHLRDKDQPLYKLIRNLEIDFHNKISEMENRIYQKIINGDYSEKNNEIDSSALLQELREIAIKIENSLLKGANND